MGFEKGKEFNPYSFAEIIYEICAVMALETLNREVSTTSKQDMADALYEDIFPGSF